MGELMVVIAFLTIVGLLIVILFKCGLFTQTSKSQHTDLNNVRCQITKDGLPFYDLGNKIVIPNPELFYKIMEMENPTICKKK